MRKAPRERTADVLDAIGGQHALSWRVWLIAYPLTLLSTVWSGVSLTGASVYKWLLVGTIAHIVMSTVAIPFRLTVFRAGDRPSRPFLAFVLFYLVGMIRGFTVSTLITIVDLGNADYLARVIGGGALTVVTLALMTVLVDSNERYRASISELSRTQMALRESRESTERVLRREQLQLIETITRTVQTPLQDLRAAMQSNTAQAMESAQQVINRLNALLDDAVKPLSRAVATNLEPWTPTATGSEPAVRPPLTEIRVMRPIYAARHSVLASLTFPSILATLIGPTRAIVTTALCGMTIYIVLRAGEGLINRRPPMQLSRALIITLPIYIAAGLPAMFIGFNELSGHAARIGLPVGGALTTTAMGSVITFTSAIFQERQDREARLRAANEELAIAVSHVTAELWAQRRHIADVLHGDVQSGLIVASARLAKGESVDSLIAPVQQALDRLAVADTSRGSLLTFLNELEHSWDGVVEITINCGPEVVRECDVHEDLSSVLQTIVQELVSNSVRHGQAQSVSITLLVREQQLEGTVADNGSGFPTQRTEGLGSQILSSAARTWSRTRIGDHTVVTFELAVPSLETLSV